jgi:hypothetical protein
VAPFVAQFFSPQIRCFVPFFPSSARFAPRVIKPVVSPTGIFILLAIVMPAFTQPLGEDDVDRGFRNCLWGLTRNSVNLIGGSLARKKQEKARKKIQCACDTFFFY